MNYIDPKAKTHKIPRKALINRANALDILLACAFFGADAVTYRERKSFEDFIMKSPESENSLEVKQALAALTEEEKDFLFS
ncbi:MAG TPA: hypothetical protein VG347_06225 [Verrucomicrobiae bacterium]|nr:hypothetical protein [Verrucomicrobiae bacterium]